jgi:DnaJ-class molecular chaperone
MNVMAGSELTLYETLGVKPDAADVDIKRCFRRLSLELHPDRAPGMESRYKQVVEAYSVLGDAEKRRLYDVSLKEEVSKRALTTRHSHEHMRPSSGQYDGLDDGRYYSYGDDGSGYCDDERYDRRRERRAYRGDQVRVVGDDRRMARGVGRRFRDDGGSSPIDDIQHTLSVSLEESFTGVSVPITITRKVNGNAEEATLYVDVPAGTDNGEIIILEGKGNIDADLRMKSHVRVRVSVERSSIFRRDGLNIVCSLEITLKEALCGFKKEITHLDGKTYLVASERGKVIGQGGRRVIPQKGFQRGHSTGSLVIVFHISMPKTLTQEQVDALEKVLP